MWVSYGSKEFWTDNGHCGTKCYTEAERTYFLNWSKTVDLFLKRLIFVKHDFIWFATGSILLNFIFKFCVRLSKKIFGYNFNWIFFLF